MNFFARFAPLRAFRDLRLFLHQREKHELIFLALSIVITGLLLIGFMKDSTVEKVYRPDIVYVQQWRADRTDAEIHAQQAIDLPKEKAAIDAQKKREADLQASFKRIDDKMKKWGL